MPCYRCGVRQSDPERGKSPWRRGVVRDQLVLICPGCQEAPDWTAELEHCAKCRSAHLIRRLGQVECLDCGQIRDPAQADALPAGALVPAGEALVPAGEALVPAGARHVAGRGPDAALADEVSRALDRILGRS